MSGISIGGDGVEVICEKKRERESFNLTTVP